MFRVKTKEIILREAETGSRVEDQPRLHGTPSQSKD